LATAVATAQPLDDRSNRRIELDAAAPEIDVGDVADMPATEAFNSYFVTQLTGHNTIPGPAPQLMPEHF
jgi:hypothetical protein